MTQIDKIKAEIERLLLADLCARLPYGVQVKIDGYNVGVLKGIDGDIVSTDRGINYPLRLVKPYLRPISSMTEEELNKCVEQSGIRDVECPNWHSLPKEKRFESRLNYSANMFLVDSRTIQWLNAHHFDYHGLIRMGLALPAIEGMYQF